MLFDFMRLYYIWGHSYEINSEEKWAHMEEVCKTVGGRDDIWYATNIEIVDYLSALRALRFTSDCTAVYNPTCTDVWIKVEREPVLIPAGKTVEL